MKQLNDLRAVRSVAEQERDELMRRAQQLQSRSQERTVNGTPSILVTIVVDVVDVIMHRQLDCRLSLQRVLCNSIDKITRKFNLSSRVDLQTRVGSVFDNPLTLTLDPFLLQGRRKPKACHAPCVPIGVNSSFIFLSEHRHTDIQTHRQGHRRN